MKKGKNVLHLIEMAVCASSLAVMLFFVFMATVCRYMKIPWIIWSDELSRNLMIWMALLGAGAVARNGDHFSVNALYNVFPDSVKQFFFAIIQMAYWAFSAFIIYYGVSNCIKIRGMNQISPGLQIPMWVLYLCVPLCGVSVGIQSSLYYIPLITGKKKYSAESEQKPDTDVKEGE